jgi:AcrR family transcriptional regulator
VLETAIVRAATDELCRSGYQGFSIERVAAAAKTSKASIYRRWVNKHDLVLEVIDSIMVAPGASVRGLGLASDLEDLAMALVRVLNSEWGPVLAELIMDARRFEPDLRERFEARIVAPRRHAFAQVVERYCVPDASPFELIARVAQVTPSLIMYELLAFGLPIDESRIRTMIEEVALPSCRCNLALVGTA